MTVTQLADRVLSLPIGDRLFLAQMLWESLEAPLPESVAKYEAILLATAKQRDADIREGRVTPCTHEDVMRTARAALQ